jgi:hypothetical protein
MFGSRKSIACAMATALAAASACPVEAKPAYKQAITRHFGDLLAERLQQCALCHIGEPEDGEHNSFGQRLAEWESLGLAAVSPDEAPGIVDRWLAIREEDSDGDGTSNLREIMAGKWPGDAADQPAASANDAETGEIEQRIETYAKRLAAYPWQPFAVVRRPPLPAKADGWSDQPIDALIAEAQAEQGLRPRPPADRATLLRRVTIDLTGLPPTVEELRAFQRDRSPNAYERVVDRLLASPAYGERWGRHWMDIWRYSDWTGWLDGGQIRDSQPHIWRWRDWIVNALNRDKPYDVMVREMLAGDELAPTDPDSLIATGYLVRNYKMLSREKWMQDVVDHTFLAFQGLTIGCARCHDHFFDPLTQREYYQLRAIFEPHQVRLDRLPGEVDPKVRGLARAYDADPAVATRLLERGDDRFPSGDALPPGVPAALGGEFTVEPISIPREAMVPDRREFVLADDLAAARGRVTSAAAALAAADDGGRDRATLEQAKAQADLDALEAVIVAEALQASGSGETVAGQAAAQRATAAQRCAAVAAARLQLQVAQAAAQSDPPPADAAMQLEAAQQALQTATAASNEPASTAFTPRNVMVYPATSTGRRLALARWLTSSQNPLTARVAVNHIWLRHFGQAIVPSVFDYGNNGRPPKLAALLDWLAAELMTQNWEMKSLHRSLVTSSTYREASTPDAESLRIDPDNLYHWRMTPRRIEAEAVRDSLLMATDRLDRTFGGAELDQLAGFDVMRRSLYFRHAAERQMPFLKLFDCAAVTECYQRRESITPQQALALIHSPLSTQLARRFTRHPSQQALDDHAFIDEIFLRMIGRPPNAEEYAACQQFLSVDSTDPQPAADDPAGLAPASDPRLRRRESLLLVLINHHEFVTLR